MKLEHLTNKSATNLYSELSSALMKFNDFSIGSAFINSEAIDLLEAGLMKNKRLNGRLLIGLYGFFNKKKDLERLLQLSQDYPARLEVSISRSVDFHWKYYHFFTGPKQVFYIGSANFTTSGMNDNREIVVKISGNKNNPESALTSLSKSFEKEWTNAGTLGTFPIKDYKETKPVPGSGNKIPQSIHDFFNEKDKQLQSRVKSDSAYAICLDSYVKASTYKAIAKQKSEWDKKKFGWFVVNTKSQFTQCDKSSDVFIFSKESNKVINCYWGEIMECENSIKTEDSNYFVAYRTKKTRKITPTLITKLKKEPYNIDLTGYKKPFYYSTLRRLQVQRLKELLKIE